VTVALEPTAFAGGDAAPDGGDVWVLPGIAERFGENPKRLVRAAETAMVRLWSYCRPGMGGPRLLPDAGGVQDQCAVMLEALAIMDDQAAKLAPKKREEPRA
jgi:hypothetical protein